MTDTIIRDERGFAQVFAPVGATPFRAGRRHDWIVREARRRDARRVLELGCGLGDAAAHVAAETGVEVVAVDLDETFLAAARARHAAANLRFVACDLLAHDLGEFGRFDLVFGNGILHHLVAKLPAVLGALRTLTRPGGGLAFIEPNFLNPYCAFIFGTAFGRRWARLEPDEMAFTPGELRRAVAEAGWRDVDVRTRDFVVPGIPMRLATAIAAIEPVLEATPLRLIAQSHFVTAEA